MGGPHFSYPSVGQTGRPTDRPTAGSASQDVKIPEKEKKWGKRKRKRERMGRGLISGFQVVFFPGLTRRAVIQICQADITASGGVRSKSTEENRRNRLLAGSSLFRDSKRADGARKNCKDGGGSILQCPSIIFFPEKKKLQILLLLILASLTQHFCARAKESKIRSLAKKYYLAGPPGLLS